MNTNNTRPDSAGDPSRLPKSATGTAGLDDILGGGLTVGHIFLLEGSPGTGKTTLALRFLLEGAARGERGLYITLSETAAELRGGAASHGWTLPAELKIFELTPPESLLDPAQQQTLLYSSDLELGETTRTIMKTIEAEKPARIVIDSLSEIRLLAQGSLRYRRQILALKHYFARLGATVLLIDDLTSESTDKTVHSVVHGVIQLEAQPPNYGNDRRRLRVIKYRGQSFRGGYHDFKIQRGGVQVYPRLVALEHRSKFDRATRKSEVPGLDTLLGGGLQQGSSTLVLGPSGTGKTTITMQFVAAAVRRGEKAAMFLFDEEMDLFTERMVGLGFDMAHLRANGLYMEQVDAAELTPGEFAHRVRHVVESMQAKAVVIDSLNGYHTSMPDENALTLHLHELLQYLNRRGATTFLTVAQHGIVGEMKVPVDVTYLADTVIVLRYFEALGEVRRAVSIVKKRTGPHETTIREFRFSNSGLTLGEPLHEFQGVLLGVPTFVGDGRPLLQTSKRSNGPA